jgi:hypothetical protein
MESSRQQVCQLLDQLVVALSAPLTGTARAEGWTEVVQAKWFRIFQDMRASVASGRDIPEASISRALDHDGVVAGPVLEKAATLSNLVRRAGASHA